MKLVKSWLIAPTYLVFMDRDGDRDNNEGNGSVTLALSCITLTNSSLSLGRVQGQKDLGGVCDPSWFINGRGAQGS